MVGKKKLKTLTRQKGKAGRLAWGGTREGSSNRKEGETRGCNAEVWTILFWLLLFLLHSEVRFAVSSRVRMGRRTRKTGGRDAHNSTNRLLAR